LKLTCLPAGGFVAFDYFSYSEVLEINLYNLSTLEVDEAASLGKFQGNLASQGLAL
jgi:hypothetical protein